MTGTWQDHLNAALQRAMRAYGYTGPIDGVMDPNSWRGFARFLNLDRWD